MIPGSNRTAMETKPRPSEGWWWKKGWRQHSRNVRVLLMWVRVPWMGAHVQHQRQEQHQVPGQALYPPKRIFGKMAATKFPLSEHFRRASNNRVKDSAFWTCYVGICYI